MEGVPAPYPRGIDDAVLLLLRARGPLPTAAVAATLGSSLYSIRLALHRLARRKRVVRYTHLPPARGRPNAPLFPAVWAAQDAN